MIGNVFVNDPFGIKSALGVCFTSSFTDCSLSINKKVEKIISVGVRFFFFKHLKYFQTFQTSIVSLI